MLKIIDACVCVLCSVTLVMSDSLQPHGLKPTRLLYPWNFPGKNTGVDCHALLQEIRVQSLGWEDLLEKEMATYSSILAWKIPWTEEPGGLQSMGSLGVRHN